MHNQNDEMSTDFYTEGKMLKTDTATITNYNNYTSYKIKTK